VEQNFASGLLCCSKLFTRDSRYCYSASQPSQFCPSVHHTGGSVKNGAS